jgi:hypothetical protein
LFKVGEEEKLLSSADGGTIMLFVVRILRLLLFLVERLERLPFWNGTVLPATAEEIIPFGFKEDIPGPPMSEKVVAGLAGRPRMDIRGTEWPRLNCRSRAAEVILLIHRDERQISSKRC